MQITSSVIINTINRVKNTSQTTGENSDFASPQYKRVENASLFNALKSKYALNISFGLTKKPSDDFEISNLTLRESINALSLILEKNKKSCIPASSLIGDTTPEVANYKLALVKYIFQKYKQPGYLLEMLVYRANDINQIKFAKKLMDNPNIPQECIGTIFMKANNSKKAEPFIELLNKLNSNKSIPKKCINVILRQIKNEKELPYYVELVKNLKKAKNFNIEDTNYILSNIQSKENLIVLNTLSQLEGVEVKELRSFYRSEFTQTDLNDYINLIKRLASKNIAPKVIIDIINALNSKDKFDLPEKLLDRKDFHPSSIAPLLYTIKTPKQLKLVHQLIKNQNCPAHTFDIILTKTEAVDNILPWIKMAERLDKTTDFPKHDIWNVLNNAETEDDINFINQLLNKPKVPLKNFSNMFWQVKFYNSYNSLNDMLNNPDIPEECVYEIISKFHDEGSSKKAQKFITNLINEKHFSQQDAYKVLTKIKNINDIQKIKDVFDLKGFTQEEKENLVVNYQEIFQTINCSEYNFKDGIFKENLKLLYLVTSMEKTLKEKLSKTKFNLDDYEKKLTAAVDLQSYRIINISKTSEINMFKEIFAADDKKLRSVLANFDCEKYAETGLPLKYSRQDYISDLKSVLKQLSPEDKRILTDYMKIDLTEEGFEKFPVVIHQIPSDFTVEMKNALEIINIFTQKFTLENEVLIDDEDTKIIFDSLIKGLPEFTTTIGKTQHKTHKYTVDIHTIKVLQKSIQNPAYNELSNLDKMVLKLSIFLHDLGKKGAVVDEGHAYISAQYAIGILEKFNLSDDIKSRIIELVKNSHHIGKYNKDEVDKNYISTLYRRMEDFKIAKIFAQADVSSVNDEVHLKWYKASDENEFKTNFENKINDILPTIESFLAKSNIIYNSLILQPEKIPFDTKYNIRMLDLNKLNKTDNLAQYGFAPGTTKDNLRLLIHMCNDSDMKTAYQLLTKTLVSPAFSTSLISPELHNTYWNGLGGFILKSNGFDIAQATDHNIRSGCGKDIHNFSEGLNMDFNPNTRTFVQNQFISAMKEKGIEISIEDYKNIAAEILHKKYLTQIKDIRLKDQIIKKEDLIDALEKSRDKLLQGKSHNEIIVLAPQVQGLIAMKTSSGELSNEIITFAKENNLPVIII